MEEKQIEEMAKIILKGEIDRNRGTLDISEFPIDLIVKVGMQRVAGAKRFPLTVIRKLSWVPRS